VKKLDVDWAWPDDIANPLSHLTLLTSLDLSANELTHLGCDVLASLRSLSELLVADNQLTDLGDVSLQCAGLRLARLDVSSNRLTQMTGQSLSSLSGLQQFDARANPFLCDGEAACVARKNFRRWLNETVGRVTLLRRTDDAVDEYACQDSSDESYISGHLDCDDKLQSTTTEQSIDDNTTRHHYTGVVILVSISAVTVVAVATFVLALGLVVGRRLWRRSGVDYCKRRQAQLLQHDHHQHHHQQQHDGHQLDMVGDPPASSRLQTLVATLLNRFRSIRAPLSSVGYRQVVAAELDLTSSSADVIAVTSSAH